jgi:uncharacterized ferritin-like protein (DUF455 family)
MSSPRPQAPSAELDVMTVPELSGITRSLHHATLLYGRALASFAPRVAELPERHLLVQTVFSLVRQSAELRTRLLEMRTAENALGGPAPETVTDARRLVTGTPEDALAFAQSLVRELAATYDRMYQQCGSEALYHDRRLYRTCRELCQDVLDVCTLRELPVVHDEIPARLLTTSVTGRPGTATGTADLEIPPCPNRAYPHWAKFVDAAAKRGRTEPEQQAPQQPDPTPAAGGMTKRSVVKLLRIGVQIEFISTDVPLRNIASFADMPFGFYLDMVRHAHDEMRHTHLLFAELARLGEDAADTPIKRPDTYDAIADQPLDYRLIILSRTGEDSAIETFSHVIPQLREAGYVEAAAMFDHVLADELRHVAYANRWLAYLCAEDDVEVERRTTACIRQFNALADELGLGEDAIRDPDHIADRAQEADIELRALAGFSRHDLEKLASAR